MDNDSDVIGQLTIIVESPLALESPDAKDAFSEETSTTDAA
jgi:hypothetical protein